MCIKVLENYGNRCQKNRDTNIKINIVQEPGRQPGLSEIEVGEMCLGGGPVFSAFGHASLNTRPVSGRNTGSLE